MLFCIALEAARLLCIFSVSRRRVSLLCTKLSDPSETVRSAGSSRSSFPHGHWLHEPPSSQVIRSASKLLDFEDHRVQLEDELPI